MVILGYFLDEYGYDMVSDMYITEIKGKKDVKTRVALSGTGLTVIAIRVIMVILEIRRC